MTSEKQINATLAVIENDIATYMREIERNNTKCTRLNDETMKLHKALNGAIIVKDECIADREYTRRMREANVAKSIDEVCEGCGAVTLVIIGDPARYKPSRFCDDCAEDKGSES